ncbi:kelch-like protein 5 [Arctopsyche grandis]|uniref:kelch-like protein 5 n=1 Tax=Arctopsyche grandis TaxID=121162 RepID=UPI00406D6B2A
MAKFNKIRSEHSVTILGRMYDFYKENVLCDLDLVIGANRLPVHKLILISNSKYFKNKINDATNEVVLEDTLNIFALKKTIEYFYNGNISIEKHQVVNLIKFSKLIKASDLEKYCLSYLEKFIDSDNFLFIEEYAREQGNVQLLEKTKKFILNNYLEIIQRDEFLNMSSDLLGELLQSDDLKVTNEEQVFKGLEVWVLKDFESRKKHLNTMLHYVRLPLLSATFFLNEVKPICYDSIDLSQLWDMLEFYINPEKRSYLSIVNSRPRKYAAQTLVIVGGESESSGEIETYNANTDEWTTFYNLNNKNRWYKAVVLENKLITIGGNINKTTTNKVLCFDLSTKQTTELQPMLQERESFAIAVIDGHIFAIGGRRTNDLNRLDSVERYDLSTNTWTYVAPMLTQRFYHQTVVIGENIYVIGGIDSHRLNTMEIYNVKQNKWTSCPSMAEWRSSFSAVVVKNYIYAIGGYDGVSHLSSVERFDIKSQAWTWVKSLSEPMVRHSGIAFNGKIICVGGYESSLVLEYKPNENEWKRRKSISSSRSHFNLLIAPIELFKN